MLRFCRSHQKNNSLNIASILRMIHLGYAYYAFRLKWWKLEEYNGPRQWQAEALNEIGEHLRNPKTPPAIISRSLLVWSRHRQIGIYFNDHQVGYGYLRRL